MIVTELYDGQGLGNQLWVYAAARSIAEHLNLPFALLGYERFKGRGFLRLEKSVGIKAEDVEKELRLNGCRPFHETYYYDEDLRYISSLFDDRVLLLSGNNKLDGLFQSEKYFFADVNRPREYFKLDETRRKNNEVSDDICVINLRGGEYKRHKRLLLPEAYWRAAIKNIITIEEGIKKFLVVTDDIRYAKAVFPEYEVLKGEIGDCYATLYSAKHVIVSNSSFSYFPVKTGVRKNVVIAPKYWARYGNRLKRWASPSNIYKSWLWQDSGGMLSTYEECLPEIESVEKFYKENYFVKAPLSFFSEIGLRKYFPKSIRGFVKYMLSVVLPKHYG
jgi:hypothetical protein